MKTYQTGNLILVPERVYSVTMVSTCWGVFNENDRDSKNISNTLSVGVKIKLLRVRNVFNSKVVIFEILTGDLSGNLAVIHLHLISGDLLEKEN